MHDALAFRAELQPIEPFADMQMLAAILAHVVKMEERMCSLFCVLRIAISILIAIIIKRSQQIRSPVPATLLDDGIVGASRERRLLRSD